MRRAKMHFNWNDLVINIVASAIVALGTLIFKRFFPLLDTDCLTILASIAILLIVLMIHYIRKKGVFTTEPILFPMLFAMIAVSLVWILVRPGLATIEESAQATPSISQGEHIGKPPGNSSSFVVYPEYDPSGYLGDIGDISVEKGSASVRFTYETNGRGPHEWEYKYIDNEFNLIPCQFAGVMYLNPPNNWGEDANGGFDLRDTRQVVKWEARSMTGVVNVEFVIGGINWKWDEKTKERIAAPYPDSLPRHSLGTKTLSEDWQSFEADISNIPEENFRSVVGGFAWVISWGSNQVQINDSMTGPEQSRTFTIEIRNIRYER